MHPADHISFTRHGRFGPGGRWHIIEAFGADPQFLLDETFWVTRLGETGFTMEVRRLGRPIGVIDELWQPSPTGLVWTVEMTVGPPIPGAAGLIRRLLGRRMGFLQRWRQHNVEEAGYLGNFLAELYAKEAS